MTQLVTSNELRKNGVVSLSFRKHVFYDTFEYVRYDMVYKSNNWFSSYV